jgi:hypothetical protein
MSNPYSFQTPLIAGTDRFPLRTTLIDTNYSTADDHRGQLSIVYSSPNFSLERKTF